MNFFCPAEPSRIHSEFTPVALQTHSSHTPVALRKQADLPKHTYPPRGCFEFQASFSSNQRPEQGAKLGAKIFGTLKLLGCPSGAKPTPKNFEF